MYFAHSSAGSHYISTAQVIIIIVLVSLVITIITVGAIILLHKIMSFNFPTINKRSATTGKRR